MYINDYKDNKVQNIFTFNGVEYFFDRNPINGKPMLARVDGYEIENRKEVCRSFLMLHGWKYSDFGSKTTNELEREVIKIISNNGEVKPEIRIDNFVTQSKHSEALSSEDVDLIKSIKNKKTNALFTIDMVEQVLFAMSKKHPFFVSEAHMQTEFIIEAAKLFPEFEYYPELVPSTIPMKYLDIFGNKGIFFDLLIKDKKGMTTLVEFKYLTKDYFEDRNGFHYEIKHQSAQDIRRYDCWHDISRIEMFVDNTDSKISNGYFILVTSDPSYWQYRETYTVDFMFRMHNGLHKNETKKWLKNPGKGTINGREKSIPISNDYYFEYKPFYRSGKKNGEFKCLIVPITSKKER